MATVKDTSRGPRRRTSDRSDTRERIVAAAQRLFVERGFAGTTIEAISEEAGVAVQTIYNVLGVKSAVLEAVLDTTAAGPGNAQPVREMMQRRTDGAGDLEAMVGLLADWFVEVHGRTAGILNVIRDAAAVDAEIGRLDRRRAAQRFDNYRQAAAEVARRGGRPDVDTTAAAIWSIGSPQTYRFLVIEQGWEIERYRDWARSMLGAVLGPEASAAPAG